MKIFLVLLFSASVVAADIVFVDMAKLVQVHPRTAHDKEALQKRLDSAETRITALRGELAAMRREVDDAAKEANNPALSSGAKKKAEENARRKQEDFLAREQNASEEVRLLNKQLADDEERYLTATTAEIRDIITKIAVEKKYTIVLPVTVGIYVGDGLDITADIIKAMGVEDPDAKKTDAKKTGAKK